MNRIYCVEDDTSIRDLVVYTLNASGFSAEGFECSDAFFAAMEKEIPDLALLDIMLPGTDGMQILSSIRNNKDTSSLPVIMLTAKSDRLDKIKGLDSGADDYITKPFDILELLSRIKAVLRRSVKDEVSSLSCKGIRLDVSSHKVFSGSAEVVLTYKEYEVLFLLLSNKNKVVTRSVLLDKVWGIDFEGETRTVDVHIRTLRQKLGENGHLIETVRNVGYRVTEDV